MFLTNSNQLPSWAIALIIAGSIILSLVIIAIIISVTTKQKFLPTLANVFWVALIGWILALIYFIAAIFAFITIIFIPIGIQYLKFVRLAIWPFGSSPRFTSLNGFKLVINIIWIIFAGWEQAVYCFVLGAICCLTIVLWPCGLQLFKFGRLVLMPLGTEIVKEN